MGIDVYMKWDGFTKDDKEAQLKGFDATIGNAGYLREAYHGDPYATMYLCPEAFDDERFKHPFNPKAKEDDDDYGYVKLAADLLVERLPIVIQAAIERNTKLYNSTLDQSLPYIKSFLDFVALYVKMEREGKHPRIYVSH